jgi:hypothetical protein
MMRLARRASLIVAFSLLTSAATAYAECAWVLWTQVKQTDRTAHLSRAEHYSILDSFVSRNECDRQQTRMSNNPELRHSRFVCLPDTIDPRGPKGK